MSRLNVPSFKPFRNPRQGASTGVSRLAQGLVPVAEQEFRILVERNSNNTCWSAWFADRPEVVVEGDEAMAAFDAIIAMQRDRLPDPYQLRVDDQQSRGGHIEVLLSGRARERKPCPSCKGSGKYVGLSIVEPCDVCGGAGDLPATA